MLVKMTYHLLGTRNGAYWPAIGETIDLPDIEAADLCAASLAVLVVPADRVERAVAPPVETATIPKRPRAPRSS